MSTPEPVSSPLIAALAEALAGRRPVPEEAPAPPPSPYQFLRHPAWPEARWNVPGALAFDSLLWRFHDFMLGNHGLPLLSAAHGSPLCQWSGEQIRRHSFVEASAMEPAVRGYATRALPLELCFTNAALAEPHLRDARGNFLLELLAKYNQAGRNGVEFTSDLLAAHVRCHYPGLRLVAGADKADADDGVGSLDYYRRQAECCDRVVVHPDDNLNPGLLEALEEKEKFEIVVNDPCLNRCPVRKLHWRMLSELAHRFFDSELEGRAARLCGENGGCDPQRLLLSPSERTLMLADTEIQGLYAMGFRHFRIQRRDGLGAAALVFDFHRLMFNPDPASSHRVARVFEELLRQMSQPPAQV